jgi:hypothetical protein
MDLGTPELIAKMDAARRQLRTAINLYFEDGDAVSIHTLAAAAHQLLSDVNDERGGSPMWREQMLSVVKPEYQKMVKAKFREPQNFFKHAEDDPDSQISFNPRASEWIIQDACLK